MITITKQLITPMLRLVLEWSPVAGAALYLMRLQEAGTLPVVEQPAERTLHRGPAMKNSTWYHVQVLAVDDELEVLDASDVFTVWSSAQYGTAPLLRQAVYDAIEAAGLDMVDDGYFQPRAFGKTSAPSVQLPAIEIGMPALSSTVPYEGRTKLHTWQVPITIRSGDDRGDPDRNAGSWLLFELVQAAIDQGGLKLERFGVMDENWTWTASLGTTAGRRTRSTLVEAVLSVPVIKETGVILLPQHSPIPDEPEAPPAL